MEKDLNITEIKDKLYKKLEPSGWAIKLRGFIYSTEFNKIIVTLAKQVNDNKRFTPLLKDVFNAFEKCPVDKLKVVIIGQDPYPTRGHANGLCFSVEEDVKPFPKSLIKKNIPHDKLVQICNKMRSFNTETICINFKILTCQHVAFAMCCVALI